ncbi:MAG: ROK family protein [Bacteroidia bacterium]|nr:ROK family protein [Bacteroidia bacterium]
MRIGIDIGGTSIKAALIDEARNVLLRSTRPTRAAEALERSLNEIHACIEELVTGAVEPVIGIGVGVPGAVDYRNGIVKEPPNMPAWERVPLADILHARWKCVVAVDNDANCAALGEAGFGAGRGVTSFIGLTLGTGVGAGIIIDGAVYHGERGFAGEFGHMTIDRNGPRCNCGNHGCIEAHVGIEHLLRVALARLRSEPTSRLHRAAMDAPASLTPKDISDAASAGDEPCADILRTVGTALGVAIASAANLLDITTFIIGGGIAGAGAPLFEGVRSSARERVLNVHRDALRILPAQLGNDAGMLGAALLVA